MFKLNLKMAFYNITFLGYLATAITANADAQEATDPIHIPTTMRAVDRDVSENNILPALWKLQELAEQRPFMAGLAAQYFAIVGDQMRAEELFRASTSLRSFAPNYELTDPSPALETIANAAASTRVVIINEAHHVSQHRAFTHRLMVSLREAGFTHIAAEAFCTTCEEIAAGGMPNVSSGLYVMDPVFGDVIRQAVDRGYELVSYEMRPDQLEEDYPSMEARTAARERAQADNLATFLKANPNARVLVHVGFAHVVEGKMGDTDMFASQLKRMTGIDPLTIDQFEATPSAINPAYDQPLYRAYAEKFGEPTSEIVVANSITNPLGAYAVDLTVVHPRYDEVNGRPGWLGMGGYRVPRKVNFESLDEPTLIRAFVAPEPSNAVPMDQVIAGAETDHVWLMLPEGQHRIVRQYPRGSTEVLLDHP